MCCLCIQKYKSFIPLLSTLNFKPINETAMPHTVGQGNMNNSVYLILTHSHIDHLAAANTQHITTVENSPTIFFNPVWVMCSNGSDNLFQPQTIIQMLAIYKALKYVFNRIQSALG